MTSTTPRDRGMSNRRAVAALSCVVIVLIGVLAFALTSMRNFMDLQYAECVERLAYDTEANAARQVQVEEFTRLGELTTRSLAFDEYEKRVRDEAYMNLAEALQRAIDEQVVPDCERLRPPTLGDVLAGDDLVIGGGS